MDQIRRQPLPPSSGVFYGTKVLVPVEARAAQTEVALEVAVEAEVATAANKIDPFVSWIHCIPKRTECPT